MIPTDSERDVVQPLGATPTANALPHLDEHVALIEANPSAVWQALLHVLADFGTRTGASAVARLVGCADQAESGPRPLAPGATIPGFHVASARPGRELILAGRHRFARYELAFRIEPLDDGRSLLRAESRAAFPGVLGGAYRRLIMSFGLHVRAVRSMLASIQRTAAAAVAPR